MKTLILVLLLMAACAPAAEPVGDLKLQVPPTLYAVPGVPFSLYYDNVVLTQTPEAYAFEVTADLGTAEARRWTVTPTAEQVGDHPLTVRVSDADGHLLGETTSTLRVVPADAGAERPLSILIIGDSLTNATVWPNTLAKRLNEPDNPHWSMLGTNVNRSALPGVRHEGYGGWTWARFATHYEPEPDGTYKKMSSPFVFLGDDGQPQLDPARYFDEKMEGKRPDVVLILLGINDMFSAPPDDPAGQDARSEAMFGHAETLLAALREAAPDAVFAVGLTTPPNSRQAAFEANYQDRYPRWGWKRIQHRLVQRESEHFGGREAEGLFVVPTNVDIDPVDGYPENNGVHPNAAGYEQIGNSFYAWVKAWLAGRVEAPAAG